MIEVKNLVKKYGSHLAVDHLNFTVRSGQIYGFLGPNGAGKSTTMNIMTGYLGATEGEVLINGHNILDEPEAAKHFIGYLPEMPPLYVDMKVREYLEFVAELKKIPKKDREDQILEVMDMVKLEDVEDRLIRNLSKGYKQRVGLAQAILGFPEIIILDEPTVGLDPKQIIEIRELIRELAKDHTVILSSHILAEIQEVCDYVMIISKGKLVASDTPENLEKALSNQQTIEILAKGNREEIRTIANEIAKTESVEMSEGKEEGTVSAKIVAEAGADIRENVFRTFAQADCPLLQMMSSKTSLEDVFLELIQSAEEDSDSNDGEETKLSSETVKEVNREVTEDAGDL